MTGKSKLFAVLWLFFALAPMMGHARPPSSWETVKFKIDLHSGRVVVIEVDVPRRPSKDLINFRAPSSLTNEPKELGGGTRFPLMTHEYEFRKNMFYAPDGRVSLYMVLRHLPRRLKVDEDDALAIVDSYHNARLVDQALVRTKNTKNAYTPTRPSGVVKARMGNADWIRGRMNGGHVYLKEIDDETLIEIRLNKFALNPKRKVDAEIVEKRIMNSIKIDIH